MSDSNFINISQRAYKFIRGFTMNYVYEGLIELITNCDDAYDKAKFTEKKIDIICDYSKNKVIVRDQAIGLTCDEMIKCFLQVGEYTSSKESRGFFSRGSKDISALGNVTFRSIKNNKFSEVTISTNAEGKVNHVDLDATNKIRNDLQIKENGLEVSIDIISSKNIDSPKFLINRFTKYFSLRKIFSDTSTKIKLEVKNFKHDKYNKIYDLTYSFPKGIMILYLTYSLPSYPDAEILFMLNKSTNELHTDEYSNDKFSDYGIMITSDKAIHDISCLDNQNTHYDGMKKLFGVINTSYINKLMYDFDRLGPTEKNPSPIIDPSRMNGINTKHPFYKELIKIPNDRIRLILEEGTEFETEKIFYIEEINDLIKDLDIVGSDILESNEITTIGRTKANNLIRGIESDRGKYINVEKNINYPLYKMELEDDNSINMPYEDPMTKIFEIIGHGDEGTKITDVLAKEKLFNVSDDINSDNVENKQIFVYDKVDIQNNKPSLESLNSTTVHKKNIFSIKFIEFDDNSYKYQINQTGGQIILKVNTNFPTIKKYFNNDKVSDNKKIEAAITLGNIISEALTKIQISNYIEKDYIKIDNDDSHTNYNTVFHNFDKYKNNIEKRLNLSISNMINKL